MEIKVSKKGTPKYLREAIIIAMELQRVKPNDALINQLMNDIKDFLAQKFNVAMLAEPDSTYAFRALFEKIFKE